MVLYLPPSGYRLPNQPFPANQAYGSNLMLPAVIGPQRALMPGGPKGFMRFVATRTAVSDAISATAQPYMVRFASFARDTLSSFKVMWANWYSNEQTTANVMTITASVEYPAGTFTQIKFAGASTSAPVAPGVTLISDFVNVNIPAGAQFWIRFYRTGTVSLMCSSAIGPNLTLGEAITFPGTDQTMGGTVVSNFSAMSVPCGIIGLTNIRSVLHIGDSVDAGTGELYQEADGAYGQGPHCINQYAWTNLGISGGQASQFASTFGPLRAALAAYATDVLDEYGRNDIFIASASSAALQASQATIRALFPAQRFYVTTIDPETTSTDSWATLGNQTVRAQESQRVSYNTAVRLNALGFNGKIDAASITESSLNSGKWKVDGTANKWTADGTHPSQFAYNAYSAGGFSLT